MDLNEKANSDDLPLGEKEKEKREDIKEDNNSRYSLKSNSEENSLINTEEKDDNIKITEKISYKENTTEILKIEYYTKRYKLT